MNVLKKINLFFEFTHHNNYFYLMPDGLYSDENVKIKGSSILIYDLLQLFSIGDTLYLETMNIDKLIKNIFSLNIIFSFHLAKNVFAKKKGNFEISDIKIDDVMNIISQFSEKTDKNVYEKFLEFMIMIVFLESVKNSKIMIGGVWQTRAIKGDEKKSGYEMFVQNLDRKNHIVMCLKPYLNQYIDYAIEEIGIFQIKQYRPYLSEYSIYLEYIYLHIQLKNTIQKLYLMLGYANESEKLNLKSRIDAIKKLIIEYETA